MIPASSPAFMLTDRVAGVTGAGSGIGRAIATEFVRAGARVHCVDRDLAAVTDVARELGDRASAHACDVSDEHAVDETFRTIGLADVLVQLGSGVDWHIRP